MNVLMHASKNLYVVFVNDQLREKDGSLKNKVPRTTGEFNVESKFTDTRIRYAGQGGSL